MTGYYYIPEGAQFMMGIAELVIITTAVYILAETFIMHMPSLYKTAAVILGLTNMVVYQGMTDVSVNLLIDKSVVFLTGAARHIPWAAIAVFMAVSAASCVIFIYRMRQRKKTMLTPASVKEFIDDMQDGICFFDEKGILLLANRKMNEISSMITGEKLLSAERFMSCITDGEESGNANVIRVLPTVITEMQDASVWDIRRFSLNVGRHYVDGIMACDITEQYDMNRQLQERLEKLNGVNERLRIYGRQVDQVVREREILTAKIRVHDDMGKCLLAFRTYMDKPLRQRDRIRLLTMWKYNMAVMRNEAEPQKVADSWEMLMKAAVTLNVDIVMTGIMPEKSRSRDILILAVHECLTNTVKHAGGSRLYIDIKKSAGWMTAGFYNDGRPPGGMIDETGGLKNLRHAVEDAGGKMSTEGVPQFLLRIEIPDERSVQ